MATDSHPQSKNQKETAQKYSLSKIANGEEDYGEVVGGSAYPISTQSLSELKDIILELQGAAVEFSRKKPSEDKNKWISAILLIFLAAIIIFAVAVALNYGDHFTKENQDRAIGFLFSLPVTLIAYIYGKKSD